jgi:hypothetical protein
VIAGAVSAGLVVGVRWSREPKKWLGGYGPNEHPDISAERLEAARRSTEKD